MRVSVMRGELLVAIINKHSDFRLLSTQHWYRIPLKSAQKWLKNAWPPQWIAFYLTKIFGNDAFSIRYYAKVADIAQVFRYELFPDELQNAKSDSRYYKIMICPLLQLPKPILSRRRRRIIFIPTTWQKFTDAAEINDLYDESPLEDRLWAEFKLLQIHAERQEFVRINDKDYALDFAIYCKSGKLDIETDGDTWHSTPERSREDNIRNNALQAAGWYQLRFNTEQVREKMADYCIPKIAETINHLGGIAEDKFSFGKKINLKTPQIYQTGLFDTK